MAVIVEAINIGETGFFDLINGVTVLLQQMHSGGKYVNLKSRVFRSNLNQGLQFSEVGTRTGDEKDFLKQCDASRYGCRGRCQWWPSCQ